jgi:integrase/recombinase XerC
VSELCGLNLETTDLARGSTWIKGKGRKEKELVPLPSQVVIAIRQYLRHRGTTAGPLFQTRGARGKRRDGRLETRSVLRIVRELGQRVGLHVWCHGLRHSSITAALDAAGKAGIGLDKVKAHSRHTAIGTLLIYADEHDRQGTQRRLADLVASQITSGMTAENAG